MMKKRKEDELFIPNDPETDNHFKVSCSMVALLLFFHDPDFRGKTATFMDSDKYQPTPLSGMCINILLKQPAAKLSIALTTILNHQETRPLDLGGIPHFRQNTFLSGELMETYGRGTGPVEPKSRRHQKK
jgi:hypothetical protein